MKAPETNTNYPKNQEHFEAEQLSVNQKRDNFIQNLPEKEREKFKTVEQAAKMMVDAGVIFYLFPFLPTTTNPHIQDYWQWNSVMEHIQHDKRGIMTEESKKMVRESYFLLQDCVSRMMKQQYSFVSGDEYFQFVIDAARYNYQRLTGDKDSGTII
jgi:hypothetical protein